MNQPPPGSPSVFALTTATITLLSLSILSLLPLSSAQSDADVMQELKKSLKPPYDLKWTGTDPCNGWEKVGCDADKRVTAIQIGNQKTPISGTLPSSLANLTQLEVFEIMGNSFHGPLPSFSGLSSLRTLNLARNNFTSIPRDFFDQMTSLASVYLDYNPFQSWTIPAGLTSASTLTNFSAISCNIIGTIPEFFNSTTFPGLLVLHLSSNHLQGGLPPSFAGFTLQSLWLNGQTSRSLNGSILVLQNMTELTEVWLNMNGHTGPIPDLSQLKQLSDLNLRDNSLTGLVPPSLMELPALTQVNLTNNKLQGPTPKFDKSVRVDMIDGTNSFCLPDPGAACDARVNALIAFLQPFGYPLELAEAWGGNDPCSNWMGITCSGGNITTMNLKGRGLTGTISPVLATLTSLETVILSSNSITGTIPQELTKMTNLKTLDLSNNNLYGTVPDFADGTKVIISGNANIGKNPPSPSSSPGSTAVPTPPGDSGGESNSTGKIIGIVAGGVCAALILGFSAFCFIRRKRKHYSKVRSPNALVIHPNHSGSDDGVKITIAGSGGNGRAASEAYSQGSSAPSDIHVVEAGNLVISIQVLRNVTNNFSQQNILGQGGFGTVYKGELHDGTKIAVKRMDSGVLGDKGLAEFKSEIAVLTKVRHRHLVGLLGYCLDGNEKLLVYEYMPRGDLSRHLFSWKEEDLKPLHWKQRLTIALDVARGVEYLHNLAQQSFIHRDLKPSNILLGDDLRAKVSDFGLVRLAPDGQQSVATRLAGTFGYLAPEYAVMGRITTKVDVYSFGVILMELITGRKALDQRQPEESQHLVPWFRRMCISKETFQKAIDPMIDIDEETLASVSTVAELAGHCTGREPHQRPEMNHAVNVLSSLVEMWKPSEAEDSEDIYGIDFDMSLPQALKKWQALEGNSAMDSSASSSFLASGDNTQTSIPTRPSGFAESFTSSDGR